MSTEKFDRWIAQAVLAPSGANLQPWAYSLRQTQGGCEVTIGLNARTLTLKSKMDAKFFAAVVSLGAFGKNLELAARLDRFEVSSLTRRGDSPATWRWVYLFSPGASPSASDLALEKAIAARVSQRQNYDRTRIREDDYERATKHLVSNVDVEVLRVVRESAALTELLSKLEALRCHDDLLRGEFFSELRSNAELMRDATGLPIETTTNSVFERLMLRLFKKFPILQLLLKIGFERAFIRSSCVRPLRHAAEIHIICGSSLDPRSGFEVGRNLQEMWLTWTTLGYSAQVIALPLLMYGAEHDDLRWRLSKRDAKTFDEISRLAREELNLDLNFPTMVIRVGKSTKSSLRSPRRQNSEPFA